MKPRAELDAGDRERIVECWRQGRKIAAIKLYREVTGAGLKEAIETVAALAVSAGTLDRLEAVTTEALEIAPVDRQRIEEALHRGHIIEAFKIYREATGAGLEEAGEAVEAMSPTISSGRRSDSMVKTRSGCLAGAAIFGPALVTLVVVLFWR